MHAVQAGHTETLGLSFQMLGQAHRVVEAAAEPGHRLQPTLDEDLVDGGTAERQGQNQRDDDDDRRRREPDLDIAVPDTEPGS
ncbi:MAG: hypothetical protein ACP5XB_19790 [Isosphaeraceae bacterium]